MRRLNRDWKDRAFVIPSEEKTKAPQRVFKDDEEAKLFFTELLGVKATASNARKVAKGGVLGILQPFKHPKIDFRDDGAWVEYINYLSKADIF